MIKPKTSPSFKEEENALLAQQMQAGLPIGILLYLSFSALDWFVAEEAFITFVLIRVVAVIFPIAALILLKAKIAKTLIKLFTLTTFYIGAVSIIAMCCILGGFASTYYVGILLYLFFAGLFLPWGLKYNLIFLLLTIATYICAGIFYTSDLSQATMPIAFLLSAAILTQYAAQTMQRSRREAFNLREARIAAQEQTIAMLKEIDKRDARLVAVGEIAGTLAHDMRGPLTSIMNRAELLKTPSTSNKMEGELTAIESSVQRVNAMIEELLEFVSGREIILEQKICKVKDLFQDLALEMEIYLKHSGINWVCDIKNEEQEILIDQYRFARIIENLVKNAKEALLTNKTTAPEIELKANCDDRNLNIKIKDNGPGIPANQIKKLFRPYTTTGKQDGNGLGLAIVQNLVAANGGTIEAVPSTSSGATFLICLPLSNSL